MTNAGEGHDDDHGEETLALDDWNKWFDLHLNSSTDGIDSSDDESE